MSLSSEFVRLETTGRRTGKPHAVLLRFITFDGKIILFPEVNSKQDWVLNIRANPSVTVHGSGRVIDGSAKFGTVHDLKDPILSVFSRKYGNRVVRETYWGQTEYVQVELGKDVSKEAYSELVYGDLEAAFDGVAAEYDRHIFGNQINVWLRIRSLGLMLRVFKPGQTILEVGCGTGTETLELAKHGIRVIATDVSSKMLSVLSSKAERAGLRDMIVPLHARPYALVEQLHHRGVDGVDGAYSTYGAVNTEPRLDDFFSSLYRLLQSDSKLILGVWNKYCLYEIAGYSLKGNPRMAVARLRNPVPVGKSRFCVSTNAYSVSSLSASLKHYFTLEKAYAVGLLLPPSNLQRYVPRGPLLAMEKDFELKFGGTFPLNRLGDHFLGVYRKNV